MKEIDFVINDVVRGTHSIGGPDGASVYSANVRYACVLPATSLASDRTQLAGSWRPLIDVARKLEHSFPLWSQTTDETFFKTLLAMPLARDALAQLNDRHFSLLLEPTESETNVRFNLGPDGQSGYPGRAIFRGFVSALDLGLDAGVFQPEATTDRLWLRLGIAPQRQLQKVREHIEHRLAPLAASADILDEGLLASLHHVTSPTKTYVARLNIHADDFNSMRFALSLDAELPPGPGRLQLRPQRTWQESLLRRLSEHRLGIDDVDDAFLIHGGHRDDARRFVQRHQASLLTLAPHLASLDLVPGRLRVELAPTAHFSGIFDTILDALVSVWTTIVHNRTQTGHLFDERP